MKLKCLDVRVLSNSATLMPFETEFTETRYISGIRIYNVSKDFLLIVTNSDVKFDGVKIFTTYRCKFKLAEARNFQCVISLGIMINIGLVEN